MNKWYCITKQTSPPIAITAYLRLPSLTHYVIVGSGCHLHPPGRPERSSATHLRSEMGRSYLKALQECYLLWIWHSFPKEMSVIWVLQRSYALVQAVLLLLEQPRCSPAPIGASALPSCSYWSKRAAVLLLLEQALSYFWPLCSSIT